MIAIAARVAQLHDEVQERKDEYRRHLAQLGRPTSADPFEPRDSARRSAGAAAGNAGRLQRWQRFSVAADAVNPRQTSLPVGICQMPRRACRPWKPWPLPLSHVRRVFTLVAARGWVGADALSGAHGVGGCFRATEAKPAPQVGLGGGVGQPALGGFGSPAAASTGFGSTAARPAPSTTGFGTTTGFGGFGSTSTTTGTTTGTTGGLFGTPAATTTTTGSTGFGGFGTPAATSGTGMPAFGSFGTPAAGGAAGSQATPAFGGFGATGASTATPAFGAGGTAFGGTSTTGGLGAFNTPTRQVATATASPFGTAGLTPGFR